MEYSHTLEPGGREDTGRTTSTHDIVGRMIDVSQARAADSIAIVGKNRMEMVLDLCRRGFAQVGCVGADGVGAIDPVHALWILDAGTERDLSTVLQRIGRRVLAGGTIVLHDQRPAPDRGRNRRAWTLRRVLADSGFLCINQDSDGGSGVLLTARKRLADGDARLAAA